jgi:hypothetical protein
MRWSEWIAAAPHKDSVSPKMLAVIQPMLAMLGCEPDPACWVLWGDDPRARYTVFAITDAGMAQVNVRVNVPGEGPRASGKLIRWNRTQIGELAVEMQGGHRILSLPLEGQILRGTDDSADQVAAFVLDVLAAIDGRRPAVPAAGRPAAAKAGPRPDPTVVELGPSAAPRTLLDASPCLSWKRRKSRRPERGRHLRSGRRPRRFRALVGRGSTRVRGRARSDLDG